MVPLTVTLGVSFTVAPSRVKLEPPTQSFAMTAFRKFSPHTLSRLDRKCMVESEGSANAEDWAKEKRRNGMNAQRIVLGQRVQAK
jgi:hypothetical protein